MPARRVACVHPVRIGRGGLPVQSANAIAALADPRIDLHAVGPGLIEWPRSTPAPAVTWHDVAVEPPRWSGVPWLRSFSGAAELSHDVRVGRTAAARLDAIAPEIVYAFTLAGLEALEWARRRGVPTVLESPNGHIRHFRAVYVDEHAAWCQGSYRGHPTPAMVERVEAEYAMADRIRVSSAWARDSLISGGVPAGKITVLQQPIDLRRYRPAEARGSADGALRVVFVGTLDLRKGFVYLLDAVRACGGRVSLEMLGGTVDRCTRRLLADHAAGLAVTARPADPREAYHRAEVAVLPTLEDGSPFAAAEAMSSGLPLIVTDCCGAREWVQPEDTGWIVEARSAVAISHAFHDALARRDRLEQMGLAAREATEARADARWCDPAVADWVLAPV